MRRTHALIPVLLLLASSPAVRAADCSALARQLSSEVLDRRWGGALEVADLLLECDPRGPNAAKASFYRARALQQLRRLDDAFPAYEEFLHDHCRVGNNPVLCEDATVSLYTLAGDLVSKGESRYLRVLTDGLTTGEPYSRTFAAIQIAKLPKNEEAKQKAIDVLVEAYRLEEDPDFQNEICLAILKIDPSKCGGRAGRPGNRQEPQWIKVRVFDCARNVEKVKVNMPFSFAKAVIESLGPEVLDAIRAEGFDVENLWEALRKMGPEDVFKLQINDGGRCEDYEIWFE